MLSSIKLRIYSDWNSIQIQYIDNNYYVKIKKNYEI